MSKPTKEDKENLANEVNDLLKDSLKEDTVEAILDDSVKHLKEPVPNFARASQRELAQKIIDMLNQATGKNFLLTYYHQGLIEDRLAEANYDINDFRAVIEVKTRQWLKDKKMNRNLRPTTLFGEKFNEYLNEANSQTTKQNAHDRAEQIARKISRNQ